MADSGDESDFASAESDPVRKTSLLYRHCRVCISICTGIVGYVYLYVPPLSGMYIYT